MIKFMNEKSLFRSHSVVRPCWKGLLILPTVISLVILILGLRALLPSLPPGVPSPPYSVYFTPLLHWTGLYVSITVVGMVVLKYLFDSLEVTEANRTTLLVASCLSLVAADARVAESVGTCSEVAGISVSDWSSSDFTICLGLEANIFRLFSVFLSVLFPLFAIWRSSSNALLGCSLGSVTVTLLGGHSSSSNSHELATVFMILHSCGASIWAGTLIAFTFYSAFPKFRLYLPQLLSRFSRIAFFCVLLVFSSGIASLVVRYREEGYHRNYILLIFVKLILFLILCVFGFIQRFALARRRKISASIFGSFVYVEVVFMALTLAASTLLSSLSPY